MRVCNNLPQPNPYILVFGGCGRLLHTLTPPRSAFLCLQFLARCHPYILLHFYTCIIWCSNFTGSNLCRSIRSMSILLEKNLSLITDGFETKALGKCCTVHSLHAHKVLLVPQIWGATKSRQFTQNMYTDTHTITDVHGSTTDQCK